MDDRIKENKGMILIVGTGPKFTLQLQTKSEFSDRLQTGQEGNRPQFQSLTGHFESGYSDTAIDLQPRTHSLRPYRFVL
jgi:hypothetical protein